MLLHREYSMEKRECSREYSQYAMEHSLMGYSVNIKLIDIYENIHEKFEDKKIRLNI